MSYCANALLGVMSTDLTFFETSVPIVTTLYKVFVAVDGQQRLTTAFLLHWYVAWRENKLNDYKNMLKNFSWDTRSYSSQFVDLLFKINKSKYTRSDMCSNSASNNL